jgi:hypothetical protein
MESRSGENRNSFSTCPSGARLKEERGVSVVFLLKKRLNNPETILKPANCGQQLFKKCQP